MTSKKLISNNHKVSVGGKEKIPSFSVSRRERERNQRVLSQGAEAKIYLQDNLIIKERISKSYRIKELDNKIRKLRTRSEEKILNKLFNIINVPKVIENSGENKIKMQFIEGKRLSENLNNFPLKQQKEIIKEIGIIISKLHKENIAHGDLTTSNMIYTPDKERGDENSKNNFRKQLKEIKKLKLNVKDYAIFGSGPLAVRGIRDSHDINIIVKENLWEKLEKKYKKEIHHIEGRKVELIRIKDIEIYKSWNPWIKDINKLIDNSEIIEDIPFVGLEYVIEWKKSYGRKKDKKDIELISNHLNSRVENETASNFKIFLIDFGLSFQNARYEDKAVDIHLFKQALEAKHWQNYKELYNEFIKSYKSQNKIEAEKILNQLNKVEKRGRYKH